jgi:hypothetical protein
MTCRVCGYSEFLATSYSGGTPSNLREDNFKKVFNRIKTEKGFSRRAQWRKGFVAIAEFCARKVEK